MIIEVTSKRDSYCEVDDININSLLAQTLKVYWNRYCESKEWKVIDERITGAATYTNAFSIGRGQNAQLFLLPSLPYLSRSASDEESKMFRRSIRHNRSTRDCDQLAAIT